MKSDDTAVDRFDPTAWEERMREIGKEAGKGTGLVYLLYQRKFKSLISEAIAALPIEHRQQATVIADLYGYSEPDEEIGDGECSHGLDPFCCPAGCGDIDDGWPSEGVELPEDVV